MGRRDFAWMFGPCRKHVGRRGLVVELAQKPH